MEKVFSNDITKYLIALAAGSIGLVVLLVNLIDRIKGAFKPFQKATFVYLLIGVLFFALIALAGFPGVINRPGALLIVCQAFFLLIGCVHVWIMPSKLAWSGDEKSFWAELVFTAGISLAGALAFLVVYYLINKNGLQYMLAGSVLFFAIPFFFYQTFLRATSIQPKILKEWFYPLRDEIEEPEESKMKNLLVISFEFQKQPSDPNVTNFRAKAPVDMELGQLFYYFINDYNERHPNSKVQFLNGKGEPNGWIFYKKPRWYTITTSYIDADKTIFNNKIRENDVIICSRSLS